MSGKVGSRKNASNLIYSTGPDVCLTPMGSSTVPVAYSSVAILGSAGRVSGDVKYNGDQASAVGMRSANSTGTEPGTSKGFAKSGHCGPAAVIKGSGSVHLNGMPTIRHKDKAVINMTDAGPKDPPRPWRK